MNLSGYCPESITEGEGMRAVVYISGCNHRCKGCFNPATWDFDHGEPFTVERQTEIIEEVAGNPLVDGITLCGGDPFFSAQEVAEFVKRFRLRCNKTVWAYSGFTFEELLQGSELLSLCDVLIDGRFDESQKDLTLLYRGSRNQRIIDVQESLKQNKIITK